MTLENLNDRLSALQTELGGLNAKYAEHLLVGTPEASKKAAALRPKITEMESEIAAMQGARPAAERLIQQAENKELADSIRKDVEITVKAMTEYANSLASMDRHIEAIFELWAESERHAEVAREAMRPYHKIAARNRMDAFYGNGFVSGRHAYELVNTAMSMLTGRPRRFRPFGDDITASIERHNEKNRHDFGQLADLIEKGEANND